MQCDGVGVFNCLEAIRQVIPSFLSQPRPGTPAPSFLTLPQSGIESTVRFYQASTSELYGKIQVMCMRKLSPTIHKPCFNNVMQSREIAFYTAGTYSERNDPLLSPFSLRRWQTDGLLGCRELPRGMHFNF